MKQSSILCLIFHVFLFCCFICSVQGEGGGPGEAGLKRRGREAASGQFWEQMTSVASSYCLHTTMDAGKKRHNKDQHPQTRKQTDTHPTKATHTNTHSNGSKHNIGEKSQRPSRSEHLNQKKTGPCWVRGYLGICAVPQPVGVRDEPRLPCAGFLSLCKL